MKVIKGTELNYVLGFAETPNKELGVEAAVAALKKLVAKYSDTYLKLDIPSKLKSFFDRVEAAIGGQFRVKFS